MESEVTDPECKVMVFAALIFNPFFAGSAVQILMVSSEEPVKNEGSWPTQTAALIDFLCALVDASDFIDLSTIVALPSAPPVRIQSWGVSEWTIWRSMQFTVGSLAVLSFSWVAFTVYLLRSSGVASVGGALRCLRSSESLHD